MSFGRYISQNVKLEPSFDYKKTKNYFIPICSGKELSVKKVAGREYELNLLSIAILRDHLGKNAIGTAKIRSGER